MPETFPPAGSLGLVTPQRWRSEQAIELACGSSLPSYELVYETYGELNAARDNAVLVCHALSGNHHAAGYHHPQDKYPGWWNTCIGPGKPLDTDRFFVVCSNNLGGCHGSTGPNTVNPATGQLWGADFPPLRVRDWVDGQHALMQSLAIEQWAAVAGGSLGGMQVMRWALMYPDALRHAIVIASTMSLNAQNIGFNVIARHAIASDLDVREPRDAERPAAPRRGLALARMLGHLTYLSRDAMGDKFGRELRSGSFELGKEDIVDFQVESYLRYQGEQFAEQFDANTYVLSTHALDYFDLAREYGDDPVRAFRDARCHFLVVSFSSDWRFSPERSREIVTALVRARKRVSYAEITAPQGHDAFLLPEPRFLDVMSAYMDAVDEHRGEP